MPTGTALLLVGVGMWRRERIVAAVCFTAAANFVHPAVMLPISGLLVLAWLPFEPRRARLLGAYAASVLAAVPAVVLTFASPVMGQVSRRFELYSLGETVVMRLPVVALPLVYEQVARLRWRWLPAALAAASVLLVAGPMWNTFSLRVGWWALRAQPPTQLDSFVRSPDFEPGLVYRVLTGHDSKWGNYQVVKAGGVLDSELFPESLHRSSFASTDRLATFLARRHVQRVVVTPTYAEHYHSNETARLEELAALGSCVQGVTVRLSGARDAWKLYDVTPC
jgi:hypothetical protein